MREDVLLWEKTSGYSGLYWKYPLPFYQKTCFYSHRRAFAFLCKGFHLIYEKGCWSSLNRPSRESSLRWVFFSFSRRDSGFSETYSLRRLKALLLEGRLIFFKKPFSLLWEEFLLFCESTPSDILWEMTFRLPTYSSLRKYSRLLRQNLMLMILSSRLLWEDLASSTKDILVFHEKTYKSGSSVLLWEKTMTEDILFYERDILLEETLFSLW